jgi:predicted protein tyrosine phosphatase
VADSVTPPVNSHGDVALVAGPAMDTTKQIVVRSVIGAHYFTSDVPWACISIVTEKGTWPEISEANRVGLLQLAFADIAAAEGDEERTFNENHAHRILDYVKDVWDGIDSLMIHCEEGNSRGPAVAAAVSRIYLGEDKFYFLPHMYWPNRLVYRILLETARKRGEYQGADHLSP